MLSLAKLKKLKKEMYKSMGNQDAVAYSQVKAVLSLLSREYVEKIPKKLIEYIDLKSSNENYQIDLEKNIENQNLSDKAINIIAFINYKYWSDEDEKKELLKIYSENDYNDNNRKIKNSIFNNQIKEDIFDYDIEKNKVETKGLITNDSGIVTFFKKIIEKIKSILK